MAIELNEPVVREVRDRLEAELPGVIADINSDLDDDFAIAEPAAVLDYVPPPGILVDFPTVGIGDAPSRFEDDTGFSATGVHELLVVAYLQDADQRALAWRLRRYAQAIVRVVLSGRQLDSAAWGTGLQSIRPGPTLVDDPDNPQDWCSWVGVQIWAKRDEE